MRHSKNRSAIIPKTMNTITRTPEAPQDNKLYNQLRKCVTKKIVEVTAYSKEVEPFELDTEKPITVVRQPTVKKKYGTLYKLSNVCHDPTNKNYIAADYSLKIGTYWEGQAMYW
jgi:hypothetical protein